MKRNPIHFFEGRGMSSLEVDRLVARNQTLEKRVEHLKRLLKAQVNKQKLGTMEIAKPTYH